MWRFVKKVGVKFYTNVIFSDIRGENVKMKKKTDLTELVLKYTHYTHNTLSNYRRAECGFEAVKRGES